MECEDEDSEEDFRRISALSYFYQGACHRATLNMFAVKKANANGSPVNGTIETLKNLSIFPEINVRNDSIGFALILTRLLLSFLSRNP